MEKLSGFAHDCRILVDDGFKGIGVSDFDQKFQLRRDYPAAVAEGSDEGRKAFIKITSFMRSTVERVNADWKLMFPIISTTTPKDTLVRRCIVNHLSVLAYAYLRQFTPLDGERWNVLLNDSQLQL